MACHWIREREGEAKGNLLKAKAATFELVVISG